jgi:hypothetical protein
MTQQVQRLDGAPEGKVRLNLPRSITFNDPIKGVTTYQAGVQDVAPEHAYSISLMPEFVETDGQGNPLPHTIEGDRPPAVVGVHSMPAPDIAFAHGEAFNLDVISRRRAALGAVGLVTTVDDDDDDDDLPKGADRQGGRVNAQVDDSPLLDLESPPQKQPGQRDFDASDRSQLSREVRDEQTAHEQRVAIGEHDDDAPLRISEDAQRVAEESDEEEGATEGTDAFKHFSEASEGMGQPGAESSLSGTSSEGGSSSKRSATKRGRSAKKATKKRGSKRRSSPRKRTSESDSE